MATNKIKKGDTVKVIAGKDKGREGKVTSVKNGKLVIEGINQVTKHTKPSQANPQGESYSSLLLSMHLMLCMSAKEKLHASVLNLRTEKVRYAKATGEVID